MHDPVIDRPGRRRSRAVRAAIGADLAALHDGVAHRRDLRVAGLSRHDVQSELNAGRWTRGGRHTVVIGTVAPSGRAQLWQAVWESGSGAVLDGAAALVAAGLRRFDLDQIDVSIPAANRHHAVAGVRLHRPRSTGPVISVGVPRVRPEVAAIRAAAWATSDRQAALLVCLVLQQRLTTPERLLDAWRSTSRSRRREFLDTVIRDVCDGAHSLGELDFGRLCRARGLPAPSRQVVRTLPGGRVYLDVAWEGIGLVVEIDGGHHLWALTPIDDAIRQNDVVLTGEAVLRIPVLGLRLAPDRFMDQVERGHDRAA